MIGERIECHASINGCQFNARTKTPLCLKCRYLYRPCQKCYKRFKDDGFSKCPKCRPIRHCLECLELLTKENGKYCYLCIESIGRDRARGYDLARKARIQGREINPEDISRMYGIPCVYCGECSDAIDHVMPIARGGLNVIENLVPACGKCNGSKNAKLLTEWDPIRVAHGVAHSDRVSLIWVCLLA